MIVRFNSTEDYKDYDQVLEELWSISDENDLLSDDVLNTIFNIIKQGHSDINTSSIDLIQYFLEIYQCSNDCRFAHIPLLYHNYDYEVHLEYTVDFPVANDQHIYMGMGSRTVLSIITDHFTTNDDEELLDHIIANYDITDIEYEDSELAIIVQQIIDTKTNEEIIELNIKFSDLDTIEMLINEIESDDYSAVIMFIDFNIDISPILTNIEDLDDFIPSLLDYLALCEDGMAVIGKLFTPKFAALCIEYADGHKMLEQVKTLNIKSDAESDVEYDSTDEALDDMDESSGVETD